MEEPITFVKIDDGTMQTLKNTKFHQHAALWEAIEHSPGTNAVYLDLDAWNELAEWIIYTMSSCEDIESDHGFILRLQKIWMESMLNYGECQ